MKNKLIVWLIAVIAIIGIIASCNNGTTEEALKLYGEVNGIPVYRVTADVTDAQMTALIDGKNVVQRIQAGWDGLTLTEKSKISTTNISAIWITTTPSVAADGSRRIIKLPYYETADKMKDWLEDMAGSL
jgi:hypothetical protein